MRVTRDALQQGSAVKGARSYLKRTDVQRIMFDVLPAAQRNAAEDSSSSRIECLLKRCLERGVECSSEEATVFFRDLHRRPATSPISHSPGDSTLPKALLAHSNTRQRGRTPESSPADASLSIQGRRGTNVTGRNLSSGRFVVPEYGSRNETSSSGSGLRGLNRIVFHLPLPHSFWNILIFPL